ncbi:MAG: hypothetical protein PWP54_66 [Thermosipho sp. (in: thermotogales)]|nr:hypothetical protein [Thermosipho sp. (in: thermotogales)]MDN5324356.1 hypothetical protein [Thermosipho sp. (in: thermotogales)]
MKKYDLKIFISAFSFLVYTWSSRILNVNLFTMGRFQISYFFIYFLVLSLISSLKGKYFLFDEIYRLWVYAFVPITVYVFFNLSVLFHINISRVYAFLIFFLISNFYKSNFEERKLIITFRTLGFAIFIMGVSMNWKIL